MRSDVKAARFTADATVSAAPARVKGIYMAWTANTADSTLELRDGGASGTVIATFTMPAAGAGASLTEYIDIPDGGMRFQTDVYANITNGSGGSMAITVFYG